MPNTVNEWQTVATINDPERAKFWQDVLGGNEIPVLSFIPSTQNLASLGPTSCYLLDLKAITDDQRQKLINGLAQKFNNFDPGYVGQNLDVFGVPIPIDGVSVSSSDSGLFFSAIWDDLDDPRNDPFEDEWERDRWDEDWYDLDDDYE